MLTMAELFSGIGGWSEAARMSGDIKVVWHSEIDINKIAIYEKRHPGIPNIGDIRTPNGATYADIYTVSFPCTGISSAGKGEGLKDANSRLWFDAERLIGVFRPKYVVIENSPNLTFRGLHMILGALATFGYYAEWTHLSGLQFGLQQRRKRLYLIAYADQERCQGSRLPIFRKLHRKVEKGGVPIERIYPGWRERRDIPQPRTYRTSNDVPGGLYRLEGTGDAIIPLIGCYILECIKKHYVLCHITPKSAG